MTTAWLFPGQGSQFVGMARDLYESSSRARAVIDAADAVLAFPLSRLMFEGPEAELTDTINAQPALLAHSIAALAALEQAAGDSLLTPAFCAGHSLGEYSAFVASGALDFADGIRLVRARGKSMQTAGYAQPGAMAAILGLDDLKLAEICREAGAVQVANFNAPGQIVISGDKAALDRALDAAKKAGAKRALPLAVSIAAHSELMRPAVESYRQIVVDTRLQTPRIPVISNVTGEPLPDVNAIRAEMLAQLTSSVQWVKSIDWMSSQGVTDYVEFGPKDVLTGLNKRIVPSATTRTVGTADAIGKFLASSGAVA